MHLALALWPVRQLRHQQTRACCAPGCGPLPNPRHASGWPSGTGTDIGASSSSAACAPARRPGTKAETADSGSVPELTQSRPGASNAAHAKFEGGRTEPISTATTRTPCRDQTPRDPCSATGQPTGGTSGIGRLRGNVPQLREAFPGTPGAVASAAFALSTAQADVLSAVRDV